VKKSKRSTYWEDPDKWQESLDCGVPTRFMNNWRGKYKVGEPSIPVLRELAKGAPLHRVQRNRVALFDATQSLHKSVTIATLGMTPPEKWGETWMKDLSQVVEKVFKPYLKSQYARTGAQGRVHEPSEGVGLLFGGYRGAFGQLHAHFHPVILNLTATKDGTAYSIGKPHELFEKQALHRAEVNKRTDDLLQERGFSTRLEKGRVAVNGVPDEMVRALSLSKKVIDEIGKAKGKTGPRARDFSASEANRIGKKTTPRTTAKEAYEHCQSLARRYDLTPEKLRVSEPRGTTPGAEMFEAYKVAIQARDACTKRFGSFSEDRFLTKLYLRGIGKPVRFETLEKVGTLFLHERQISGIEKTVTPDGVKRFHVMPTPGQGDTFERPRNEKGEEKNGKPEDQKKEVPPDPRETLKRAERPYLRDAWQALKAATTELGASVLVATTEKATDVIGRMKDYVSPPPKILRVDAAILPAFIEHHSRMGYFKAHAKAALKGVLSPGNPHEKALVSERYFAAYRHYTRVPRNTVVVVERGSLASAPELRALSKIAKRDRCSVVLSERPEPEKTFERPKGHGRRSHQSQTKQAVRMSRGRDD